MSLAAVRRALARALVNVDAVQPNMPQIRAALESAAAHLGPAPPPRKRAPRIVAVSVRGTKVVRRRL